MSKLYEQLAGELATRIEQGYYPQGARLPSIRTLSQEHKVSISTVQTAFQLLEARGLVEARQRSGYYVSLPAPPRALPDITRPPQHPLEVSQWEQVLNLLCSDHDKQRVLLSRAMPDLTAATLKPLSRLLAELSRRGDLRGLAYDDVRGTLELRQQISRLAVDSGCRLATEGIVITTGCQEALASCLRVLTRPGDIVAVDSPSFYGVMQAIKALGLKALEIPTHPEQGISLDALELALQQWPIKVLQVTPTGNNPLGYTMPDSHKQRLMAIARQYDLAIIEDDVYGDLTYRYPRPRTIKSFDEEGRVLLCSSFSKTLAPGLRVGWVSAGRYGEQLLHQKYVSSASCASLPQLAVAEFIAQGGYERHLRKMRHQYQSNRDRMLGWVEQYFPAGTRISYPQGGFLLWVELPDGIDAVQLNDRLQQQGVSIAPGVLFSASGKYRNCCRINYIDCRDPRIEPAVQRIGQTANTLLLEAMTLSELAEG